MILSLLTLLIFQLFGVQGEINVILKDIECPVYDANYLTETDTYIDDNNAIFLNASIIKAFPEETEGYFALVGASMGEYVVDIGLAVRMPLCDMLNEPVILGPILRVLGCSEDNCPPQPGIYGSEGYTLPTTAFPDDFPPNQYKAVLELTNGDEEIMILHIFVDIQ